MHVYTICSSKILTNKNRKLERKIYGNQPELQ